MSSSLLGAFEALRNAAPEGRSLPERTWRRRHTGIMILLWLHAAVVAAVAMFRGFTLLHSLVEAGVIVIFAAAAANPAFGRRIRSIAAVLGLVSSSAVLVHLSGGNIEMHFHFFVMVVIIGLYQDWVPFLLAIGYVVVHHGTIGVLDPGSVYNHPGAIKHPWLWAGVHGVFILAESVASMIAWRLFESAHRQSQLLLESAGEGIYGLDLHGRVTFVNAAAASMLGTAREDLIGKEMHPLTHHTRSDGSPYPAEECPIYDTFRKGTTARQVDEVFWHADGTSFPVEYSSTPIRERGRLVGAVVAIRDVTAHRQLTDQLRQSQKMEAVGQLAGGVAHDFNNILGVIINNAEFLAEDIERGTARGEDVEEIRVAGERAAKLVGQLLSFSRKDVAHPVVLDLNEHVGAMEQLLRRTLPASIDLRFELADGLWATRLDPSQVHQLVLNLAVNAGDAMPGGGKLTFQTSNVEVDEEFARLHPGLTVGRSVCLSVSDSGVGMTEEVRLRVFEPFFTTKPRGSGTGLGLSTVYGIVKQADGHVSVYSEPGLGTSFKIYLAATDSELTQPPADDRNVVEGGRGEKVLVVEDEEALREVVERVLTRNGYEVVALPCGREALRILAEDDGRIALLLTDVVMPGVSGPELAKQAAEIRPDVRHIFMSGYPDHLTGGVGNGDSYLQKPFTAEALLAKVRETLDGPVYAVNG
ncbi:MAG: ATP-binding protein [Actinomycetota bacterium]